MFLRAVWVILFSIVTFSVWAQIKSTRNANLLNIESITEQRSNQEFVQATQYSRQFNIPMKFEDGDGNHVYLIGIDELGMPIYYTTLNEGAAATTGVSALRLGGALGLNLEGKDIKVGVWDESLVKDHIEFGNRLLSKQGSTVSRHSTHVTGTIMAAGINPVAKGMAPKALVTTWDFKSDLPEMASLATSDQSGLLLSNHSYSTLLGFYKNGSGGWEWAGHESVSTTEEYRFGFYNQKSYFIDLIAYNAPYYTIVWAAGNERTDVGNGTRMADGNGGTGYDCINPEGSAKNNITVGAVQKVLNYTDPSSVVMSSFSSWGPTDDGRIKPDLVAAGISVYSTSVTGAGADSYETTQGTSQAAPNTTGSLVLLQELYRDLHGGNFMKSASLKALAIHTTKEAGTSPGPDYSFGWGLLDDGAAASVLLREKVGGAKLEENTLTNGATYIQSFEPQANTKITATLAWTDPPGNSPEPQVDPVDLMLINDLDIRIVDETGNEFFPWTLNPITPSAAATKGDNVRDNVEKIEFIVPDTQTYSVKVTHKGILLNGFQDYSIVLTFTPATPPADSYYWIGNSGNWDDPTHWSLTSGGASANQIPASSNPVIVDENSFSSSGSTITLTSDATCGSLIWLTKKVSSLSLSNHKLTIEGDVTIASNQFGLTSTGKIELANEENTEHQINLTQNDLSKLTLIVNGVGDWKINNSGIVKIGEIQINRGGLIARNLTVELNRLLATSTNTRLDISNTTINQLTESTLQGVMLNLITTAATQINLHIDGADVNWNNVEYNGTLTTAAGSANLTGTSIINIITVGGELSIHDNNTFREFHASPGAQIILQEGSHQQITSNFLVDSQPDKRVSIATSGVSSMLSFTAHYKKCFDFLDVSRVTLQGDVTINVGENGTLDNATGWFSGKCENALYANFDTDYTCVGSVATFTDNSEGNVTSWEWNFGDPASENNSSDQQHTQHIFSEGIPYIVTLMISDGANSKSFAKEVIVTPNNLTTNKILIANNNKLFSEKTASEYQWYQDGEALVGETGRYYEYNGSLGTYFVLIKSKECNFWSTPFLITGMEDEWMDRQVQVFPNPAIDNFIIKVAPEFLPYEYTMINPLGQVVKTHRTDEAETIVEVKNMMKGVYILHVSGVKNIRRKVMVTH